MSQARTAGRADIDSDEKTVKRNKKPSDNGSNNFFCVPDGVVGNVTAEVRLGEAFEPPHAVDDVANFQTDVVVDKKYPGRVNVNVNSCLTEPNSLIVELNISQSQEAMIPPYLRLQILSFSPPLPAVGRVLVPMPLLVAPVEIPHEKLLAIPGTWRTQCLCTRRHQDKHLDGRCGTSSWIALGRRSSNL